MSTYSMGKLRVIDLSKHIDPATENRRCHLSRFLNTGRVPDYQTDMDLMSHLGTHCECPYHHDNDWPDALSLPLTSFMGRGLYRMIEDVEPNGYITANVLDALLNDTVQAGDVVILDSPYHFPPFTEKTNSPEDKRLFVNGETARWMVEHQVKCVGFGYGVSIENSNEDVRPFHDICMKENITFLEVMENLDALRSSTFFISFVPLPIKGLDSCPVRVYAIEGLQEF